MTIQTYTATASRKEWKGADQKTTEETAMLDVSSLLKAKRQATKLWPYRDGWQVTIWDHEGLPVARKRYPVDIWTH